MIPINNNNLSPFSLRAGIPPGLQEKKIFSNYFELLQIDQYATHGTSSSSSIGSLSA